MKRDADGRYDFVDRRKDALRRRGENISSFEVERTLNEYPDVYESAVVAVPSDLGRTASRQWSSPGRVARPTSWN